MGVALLPESCRRLPHAGAVFHPLDEVVYSKTYLLWQKENFSEPLQHYINIVSECFEGTREPRIKKLPASRPEKKRATGGATREMASRSSTS